MTKMSVCTGHRVELEQESEAWPPLKIDLQKESSSD